MNVAEKPAFCTEPSETNFTNILFVVDLMTGKKNRKIKRRKWDGSVDLSAERTYLMSGGTLYPQNTPMSRESGLSPSRTST